MPSSSGEPGGATIETTRVSGAKIFTTYWFHLSLVAILFLAAVARVHFLPFPLDRDEGEYAYAAQLILQGIPPYVEVYSMKMPGMYAVYALILAVLGQSATAIHFGLLLVNALTTILLFALAKKLYDSLAAVVTSASFAVLSLSQTLVGASANAEHFVILPVVAGVLLLLRATVTDRVWPLFTSGLLFGVGFVLKQHGAAFIALAGLYVVLHELRQKPLSLTQVFRRCLWFGVGAVTPFAATCLLFFALGVFDQFWFWTFTYAREYGALVPLSHGWLNAKYQLATILRPTFPVWILAGVGLTALVWDERARFHRGLAAAFFICSLISVCPGLYFRDHYFILVLPPLALLAGIGASALVHRCRGETGRITRKVLPLVILILALAYPVYSERRYFFTVSREEIVRSTYGLNPILESAEIAHHIRTSSTTSDRVAVLGSEPQIYFYAQRRAGTKYIYMYPLMEPHKYALAMQQEMIADIEASRPKFLVFVNLFYSWLSRPSSERLVFDWFAHFHQRYYQPVGIADIVADQETIWRWGEACAGYQPRSNSWVAVLQRKDDPPASGDR
jgi:4-amino-4-deoxy-L-arabinose transferase-like glycosyltransferase